MTETSRSGADNRAIRLKAELTRQASDQLDDARAVSRLHGALGMKKDFHDLPAT
jgi:hypothetical protein